MLFLHSLPVSVVISAPDVISAQPRCQIGRAGLDSNLVPDLQNCLPAKPVT